MKATELSEPARNNALNDSIGSKKPVQVSHKGESGWQLYKGYLQQGNIREGITLGQLTPVFGEKRTFSGDVGISFRLGHKKMMCHTSGDSSCLKWPTNLTSVQRKAFERYSPPECLAIRMRPLEDRDSDVIYGEVKNISTGGLQVSIRDKGKELLDSYSCSIDSDPCIVADTVVRAITPIEDERLLVGMQFVGLELEPSLATMKRVIKVVSRYARRNERRAPARARRRSIVAT